MVGNPAQLAGDVANALPAPLAILLEAAPASRGRAADAPPAALESAAARLFMIAAIAVTTVAPSNAFRPASIS